MIEKHVYDNCLRYKLRNRRVTVAEHKNNGILIQLEVRTDDLTPKFSHTVVKDKIVVTTFVLSVEGAAALCDGLGDVLTKKGFDSITDINKADLNESV